MTYPVGGAAAWFGMGQARDSQLLVTWRDAPRTYFPGQEDDPTWNADRYEVILGQDVSGTLFEKAARLALQNQFYPADVLTAVSDFDQAGRTMRAGDRVLQRIRVVQVGQQPILEVLTMNEITEVIEDARRVSFTYATTAAHAEVGEWSPSVVWRENGEVALILEIVSRFRPGTSYFSRRFSRRMQLRAHRRSLDTFVARLKGDRRQVTVEARKDTPALTIGVLQAGLLILAAVAVLNLLFHARRKLAR